MKLQSHADILQQIHDMVLEQANQSPGSPLMGMGEMVTQDALAQKHAEMGGSMHSLGEDMLYQLRKNQEEQNRSLRGLYESTDTAALHRAYTPAQPPPITSETEVRERFQQLIENRYRRQSIAQEAAYELEREEARRRAAEQIARVATAEAAIATLRHGSSSSGNGCSNPR